MVVRCPLPAYNDAGVDVRLGTDGAASSSGSGLDMLAEARLAAVEFNAMTTGMRHLLPAADDLLHGHQRQFEIGLFGISTIFGCARLGRSAMIAILRTSVFNGADCLDLWVDGEALRRDGVTLSVDEARAIDELDSAVETYYQGVGSNQ